MPSRLVLARARPERWRRRFEATPQIQNVRVSASRMNELTHMTPSSAFRSRTAWQSSAPPVGLGPCNARERWLHDASPRPRPLGGLVSDMSGTYERAEPRASGGLTHFGRSSTASACCHH
jgi:hypothetical protein